MQEIRPGEACRFRLNVGAGTFGHQTSGAAVFRIRDVAAETGMKLEAHSNFVAAGSGGGSGRNALKDHCR
jgi:hypothetical protein